MVVALSIQGNDSQIKCDADAVENIDIGGPSMLRSAAKETTPAAVVSPADYAVVLEELSNQWRNCTKLANVAPKVFLTAAYDT